MRITVNIDDKLLADAARLTGIKGKTALIHEALLAVLHREAMRRLAALGGTMPGFKAAPRRRTV